MSRARAQGGLLAYLASVVAVTLVHDACVLAAGLALALLASGAARWRLLWRTLRAVLLVNLGVSLSYALLAWWQQRLQPEVLVLLNLRVLLLVYLGFWCVARVNLLQALAFSPTLSLLATLAAGQVAAFTRVLQDFRLAFISRTPGPARLDDRLRHTAAQAAHLLDRSVAQAAESAMAMRSRGCFDLPEPTGHQEHHGRD